MTGNRHGLFSISLLQLSDRQEHPVRQLRTTADLVGLDVLAVQRFALRHAHRPPDGFCILYPLGENSSNHSAVLSESSPVVGSDCNSRLTECKAYTDSWVVKVLAQMAEGMARGIGR